MKGNVKAIRFAGYIVMAGSILMLLSLVFIQVWAAYYTVYNADDFSIANSMRPLGDSSWDYLMACFRYVKKTYLSWQGTYSSIFVWSVINPLSGFGLGQLRVIMVLNILLFFSSLSFVIFTIFTGFLKGNYHIKLFICACAAYMVVNSGAYPQVFFWFNGAATYCFPFTCLLFSLGFFILSNTFKKKRVLFAVLASLFGIGSQGGSLSVAGVGCYLIFVLCFLFWLSSKRLSVTNMVVALIYLIGALVNTAAPGNYVRHAQFDDGIHPVRAIGLSITEYLREMKMIVSNNQFCVIFLLLVLCGAILYIKIRSDIKIYTAVSMLLLITPMAAVFPVILGYGGNANIPNRVLFIINAVMVLVYSNLAIVAGYWIAEFMKSKSVRLVWFACPVAVLLLVFFVRVFVVSDVRDTVMIRTLKNLYHGRIQEYYADCKEIYEYIAESSEADVVIENYPQRVDDFGIFELYPDPNEWVNTCVAKYYYKNSVRTTD